MLQLISRYLRLGSLVYQPTPEDLQHDHLEEDKFEDLRLFRRLESLFSMYTSTLSHKQVVILLPLILTLSTNVLSIDNQRRAFGCDGDDEGSEAPTLNGPTSDKTARIGVEFEAGGVLFQSTLASGCSTEDTDVSKQKLVNNRQGKDWKLTVDTIGDANVLTAEYILDGTQIKLDAGTAKEAAAAVENDFVCPTDRLFGHALI